MNSKKTFQKGFTFVELTIVMALLLIVILLVTLFINPAEQMEKSRDEKRLSDILVIDRAINEFVLNNKRYPDQEELLRHSNVLPSGSPGLNNSNLGWIYDNLSPHLSTLPSDPINDNEFFYSYFHNATGYEINAILEFYIEKMSDDGGNDPNVYEIGNSLNLISP